MKQYVLQVLIAIDQLFNALLGGHADETLSSRSYRANRDKRWYGFTMHLINGLFCWQKQHCECAYKSERDSRHLPPEFRK